MKVTREEFAWREWFLGEGRFADDGPRNPAERARTGAPQRIPRAWWRRLEAFLARRNDSTETPRPKPKRPRFPRRRADGDLQLSEHFRLAEFHCKDGRRVPRAAVPALVELCRHILEPMRARYGPAIVVSGYRHTRYNRRIGGARYSQHIYDLGPESVAADVVFAKGKPNEWADYADRLGAGGVGRYSRSGFVHVDNRAGRARWSG